MTYREYRKTHKRTPKPLHQRTDNIYRFMNEQAWCSITGDELRWRQFMKNTHGGWMQGIWHRGKMEGQRTIPRRTL